MLQAGIHSIFQLLRHSIFTYLVFSHSLEHAGTTDFGTRGNDRFWNTRERQILEHAGINVWTSFQTTSKEVEMVLCDSLPHLRLSSMQNFYPPQSVHVLTMQAERLHLASEWAVWKFSIVFTLGLKMIMTFNGPLPGTLH